MVVQNTIAFTNSFLEYLVVFGVSVAVALAACFLGVSLKKRKDARLELEASGAEQTGGAVQGKTEE